MSDVRIRVGLRLREWRLRRRLTQESLAERASLSYKFIGEIERGAGNPTVDTLDRLAAALGVDALEFFVPFEGQPVSARFAASAREAQVVREALDSLRDVFGRLEKQRTTYYPRRRRRGKPPA